MIDYYFRGLGRKIICSHNTWKFDSQPAVEQLLDYIRHSDSSGRLNLAEFTSRDSMFSVFAQNWLAGEEERVGFGPGMISPKTIKERRRYERIWSDYFKETNLSCITTASIEKFYRSLPSKTPTQNLRVIECLRSLFTKAHDARLIHEVPRFPERRRIEHDVNWIPRQIQDQILDQVEPRNRPVMVFCVLMGCRPSEARALRWRDVDLNRGTVKFRSTFSGKVWLPRTKGGTNRELPLREDVLEIVNSMALKEIKPDEFVFLSKNNRPYGINSMTKIWNRASERAGIGRINLKDGSRTSVAMQILDGGGREVDVKHWLRHGADQTFKHYTDVSQLKSDPIVFILDKKKPVDKPKRKKGNFCRILPFSRDYVNATLTPPKPPRKPLKPLGDNSG